MIIFRRLLPIVLLSLALAGMALGVQARATYARQVIPLGSCGDTISDDAQLFGNQLSSVLDQAQALNNALKADTRVVTVSQSKLASNGNTFPAYTNYIQSRCPNWNAANSILLVETPGKEPFLRLGSTFSSKMSSADFQQMTQSIRNVYDSGNYAQATTDLLKQIQKKLTPDYTWLWITIAVVVLLVVAAVIAFIFFRRRQALTIVSNSRNTALQAKEAAVHTISGLDSKIEELTPRLEVLTALVPATTATQLQNLFGTAKQSTGRVQESLGNLLGRIDTNPNTNGLQPQQYRQMQQQYGVLAREAQEPRYLLDGVEEIVQRLERNPQERIDIQQLLAQGRQSISPQDYSSRS